MLDKKIFTIAFLFLQLLQLSGEETASYYYIYLKDKTASTYSIDRPLEFLSQKAIERRLKNKIDLNETDLPINSNYIKIINETCNCQVLNTSKWLNAVEISAVDTQNINKIRALNFVQAIKYLGTIKQSKIASIAPLDSAYYNYFNTPKIPYKQQLKPDDYGQAFTQNNQLNLLPLHNSQFRGQGITVAIIDAGFLNVYKTPGMYFNLNTLVVHDFVAHDNSVWEDDRHGANCLSFMKTNDPGTYIGSAPLATYILLRSEEAATEYPTEEVNWISAAEFADSCGVDLISSSLGYNTFNESALNHTHADLNGKTSIIAKAANIARLKGIYVVVSAGNEGKSAWHKIGTPSDAIGALTIGATDGDGYHADFSSFGPSADLRVKPDFVAMGKKAIVASKGGTYAGNGTSYSTPLFAGALACLMQACPNNTYEEIKQALIKSATHQAMPDSAYGYGMPDFALAAMFLGNYLGLDTSKDIFWENSIPTTFQNQNIYFRSGSNQTVEIKITGTRKKKTKQLIAKKIMLKNGEWLNNDELFLILNNGKKLKKRKRLNTLSFELVTSTATYQRVFKLAK